MIRVDDIAAEVMQKKPCLIYQLDRRPWSAVVKDRHDSVQLAYGNHREVLIK